MPLAVWQRRSERSYRQTDYTRLAFPNLDPRSWGSARARGGALTRLTRLFALTACVLAAGCFDTQQTIQEVAGLRADRPTFDGAAAFSLVETQVAFGPRIPGSQGRADQLAWMIELLGPLADTVFTDDFTYTAGDGNELALTNVHARFGPVSGPRVLLLTHWDTRPWADQSPNEEDRVQPVPGANDGASGTAILLGLASMFHEQAPPLGVELLFVDGEDYGPGTEDMFLGAKHFAETRAGDDPPIFAILLDMVGDAQPRFPTEPYSVEAASQVVQRVWGIARQLGYGAFFPMDMGPRIQDDHLALIGAGIPTIDIIDFDYGPSHGYWHTLEDTPDKTSSRTLAMVGEVVAEVVYRSR